MAKPPKEPLFIYNRTAAAVAVILTGYVAALAVREVVLNPAKRPDWLLAPLYGTASWGTWTANAAFFGFSLWIGVSFLRAAQTKERVVVAGWLLSFLLDPIARLAPKLTVVARYLSATMMGIAFLAALSIFLGFDAADRSQGGNAEGS